MKMRANSVSKPLDISRHRRFCGVCKHQQCAEIELAYINWKRPAAIADEYGLKDRSSIIRHANAFRLYEKRGRNVKAALEALIERSHEVDVTAASVVGAVQAYAKINAAGEWIERHETQTLSMHDLFERMTSDELLMYAESKTLPSWFQQGVVPAMPATALDTGSTPDDGN